MIIFEHNYSKKYISSAFWDGLTFLLAFCVILILELYFPSFGTYLFIIFIAAFSSICWFHFRKLLMNASKIEILEGQVVIYSGVSFLARISKLEAHEIRLSSGRLSGLIKPRSLRIKSVRKPWDTFYINELDGITAQEMDRAFNELKKLLTQETCPS